MDDSMNGKKAPAICEKREKRETAIFNGLTDACTIINALAVDLGSWLTTDMEAESVEQFQTEDAAGL